MVELTPWQVLETAITHLSNHSTDNGSNIHSQGPAVDLSNVHVWENFMANGELERMMNNPNLSSALFRHITEEELDQFIWGEPKFETVTPPSFEQLWSTIQRMLNVVQKRCASEIQKTANPTVVVMGDGSCATRSSSQAFMGAPSRPDFASFQYVPGTNENSSNTDNRIPGDAKSAMNIRRSMLPPDGPRFYRNQLRQGDSSVSETAVNQMHLYMRQNHSKTGYIIGSDQLTAISEPTPAQEAINQIHHYMQKSGTRFGYLINPEELIFFRRRENEWGHIDISPAIRHDVKVDVARNVLNSKLVLFYFHLVVANDESQWRFSCDGSK